MAPKAKAKAAAATDDDDPEVSRAAHLSANLKKSHKARTDALFKRSDVVSEHVKDEAERAALDPNMILMIYLAFLAHLLNPCARPRRQCTLSSHATAAPTYPPQPRVRVLLAGRARYRQCNKVVHETWCLVWFLLLGDSGIGKSKVRPAHRPPIAHAHAHAHAHRYCGYRSLDRARARYFDARRAAPST